MSEYFLIVSAETLLTELTGKIRQRIPFAICENNYLSRYGLYLRRLIVESLLENEMAYHDTAHISKVSSEYPHTHTSVVGDIVRELQPYMNQLLTSNNFIPVGHAQVTVRVMVTDRIMTLAMRIYHV